MKIDVNKNSYAFVFAGIVVSLVTIILSATSISLKDLQKMNIEKEKKQSILSTIGVNVNRDEADKLFESYIKEQLTLGENQGDNGGIVPFDINMALEVKKPKQNQKNPLFIAEKDGAKYYIIPLRGDGLWDAIWGYIALEEDVNTVKGVYFDHKSETPGLGAEISKEIFKNQFIGKKIFNENNQFESITVVKGGIKTLPKDKQIYAVDAISGGTITSYGVSDMIKDRLEMYVSYLSKVRDQIKQAEHVEEEHNSYRDTLQ